MPILGMTLRTIDATRKKDSFEGEVRINSTPTIGAVKEINVPAFDKKAVGISFDFNIVYEPDVAQIKMSGDMLYIPKAEENVMKKWKTDKKLPESVTIEVLDHIFRHCLIKCAVIAEDLQLPMPMPIPKARPVEKK